MSGSRRTASSRGERPAADRVPRALLRALRRLRLHRRARGRARRRLRRPADWQELLDAFWRDFKPKAGEVMEQQAVRDHRRARRVPRALAVPRQGRRHRPAALPAVRQGPAVACAAASSARSSPAPTIPSASITRQFGAGRRRGARRRAGRARQRHRRSRSGRFGPYVERRRSKRASIPKDVPQDSLTSTWPSNCCRCRATIGAHPESGQADHRLDRPLRPVPRPRRQICAAGLDRRGVRDRHERGGRQARRGRGRRRPAQRRLARADRGARARIRPAAARSR